MRVAPTSTICPVWPASISRTSSPAPWPCRWPRSRARCDSRRRATGAARRTASAIGRRSSSGWWGRVGSCCQRAEGRGQRAKFRGQRAEGRQRAESSFDGFDLTFAFCLLTLAVFAVLLVQELLDESVQSRAEIGIVRVAEL